MLGSFNCQSRSTWSNTSLNASTEDRYVAAIDDSAAFSCSKFIYVTKLLYGACASASFVTLYVESADQLRAIQQFTPHHLFVHSKFDSKS